jgi:nitrite reductase/ring-hydroxylating ferredoxin subunit
VTDGSGPVTTLDELRDGPQVVTVDDRKFPVCDVEGDVRAYRNVCPHQYGPVVEGRIDPENDEVICPWHGWTFRLSDGWNPLIEERLSRVDASVEEGRVYLAV